MIVSAATEILGSHGNMKTSSHHSGGTLNENGVVRTLQRCKGITGATAAFC